MATVHQPGSPGLSSVQAREILLSVWPSVTKEKVIERVVLQFTMAIFRAESGYGTWRKGSAMEFSHNWGAHQCPRTGKDCSPEAQKGLRCALYSDTKDGTDKTRFPQCFRVFDSHEEGAIDGLRLLFVDRKSLRGAMLTGDALLVSHVMKKTSYYSKGLTTRYYAFGLYSNAVELSAKLGQECLVTLPACSECGAGVGERCEKGCSGPGPVVEGGEKGEKDEVEGDGVGWAGWAVAGVVGLGVMAGWKNG